MKGCVAILKILHWIYWSDKVLLKFCQNCSDNLVFLRRPGLMPHKDSLSLINRSLFLHITFIHWCIIQFGLLYCFISSSISVTDRFNFKRRRTVKLMSNIIAPSPHFTFSQVTAGSWSLAVLSASGDPPLPPFTWRGWVSVLTRLSSSYKYYEKC